MNPTEPDKEPPVEISEENLVAYLDGELEGPEAAQIATQLSLDPKLRAKAEELQRTYDLLDFLPRPEPSADFASRTISQILPPVKGSGTLSAPVVSQSGGSLPTGLAVGVTSGMIPIPQNGFPIFSAFIGVILLLASGPIGYFVREQYYPHAAKEDRDADARMVNDIRLIKNMRLFRYADDLEFIRKLDDPELFGEEGE
ncbi:MAG: hypothetical protein N2112_10820 [Gemmataceae bacterium]|jgi:hypothetical protein|nr:hypothetical protein [Gemmataceae bacterium]